MKNSTKTTLVSCFTLIFVIGICLFSYSIINFWILPKKHQVNLEINNMLPKDSQVAFATKDGAIWLGSPESKEAYMLISGTEREPLVELYWSDSGNELFVIRQVAEKYYLSVVDFSNNKVHLNILGPSTERTWAVSGTDPSMEPYICVGTNGIAFRYFINTSKTEPILNSLSCDPKFSLYEIPLDMLPKDIEYRVKKVPQSDHLFYVSDYRYGTLIYDTNRQQLTDDYKEWVVDCWVRKDFFIAHQVNTNANELVKGIYKVNLDGSSEFILPPNPIAENVSFHFFRLPFCSPDGEMLFFWDILRMGDDQWTNILYATQINAVDIKTVWTLDGFYGDSTLAKPFWIPNSKKFLMHISITSEGKGSLTLVESNTLNVIPIAGSYIENKNINDISLVSEFSISPDGRWINFRGTTSGEYERDYLVQNDGTNLAKIASDRLAGTISCGNDWSPSSKFIMCYCVDNIQNDPTSHLCFVDITGKVVSEFINSIITTSVSADWKPIP